MQIIQIVASFLLLGNAYFFQNKANSIEGKWKVNDNQRVVVITYQNNGKWIGKVIKSDKSTEIGRLLLKDVYFDAAKNKWRGYASPPDRDMTVEAELVILPNGELKMTTTKFWIKQNTILIRQ